MKETIRKCDHRWVGNICTECGVAYHIAQEAEIKQLRAELDRIKRQAATMRQAISDFVHNIKYHHIAGWGDVSAFRQK